MRFLVLCAAVALAVAGPLAPTKLRVKEMPSGSTTLSVVEPAEADGAAALPFKLTWANGHTERAATQVASRVVIGTSEDVESSAVWDSGMVANARSTTRYSGPALKDAQPYYWAVQWKDAAGETSPLSSPSMFVVGPSGNAWNGTAWIGNNLGMLRRDFTYTPTSGKVMAYVAGIGFFQLYVNGFRVDTDVLSGAWTTWNERVLYFTYDITSFLTPGDNVIGVMLGLAWRDLSEFPLHDATGPCDNNYVMLDLAVLDSSSNLIVGSDAKWTGTANGPITSNHVYNGETYDARLEQPGWSKAGFVPPANGGWQAVTVNPPSCFNPVLSPASFPGVGVDFVNSPKSITRLSPTSQVVNFGDNLSGWTKITVTGPAGSNITLKHAEVLQHPPYGPVNGEIYQGNLRSALATDTYILKGDPAGETFEPHFTYHGYQYVEVLYYPGDLSPANVQQIHFHTLNPQVSKFTSSSPVLNKIQYGAMRGQGSNMMTLPTDCDQRDERLGWTGDADLSAETFEINYDCSAFIDNFLQDMADAQDAAGSFPDTVPFARYGGRPADPSWSAAFPENLWARYAISGDTAPAQTYWSQLMLYFSDIAGQVSKAGGFSKWPAPYGDWVPADPNAKISNSVCAAYNYVANVKEAAKLATALNNPTDAAQLTALAANLTAQYTQQFYDPATGCWGLCGQSGYGFAYQTGVVPSSNLSAFTTALVQDITVRYTNHVSVGIIGSKALFPTLTALNQSAVALALAEGTSYPSYGYMFYNDLEPANSSLWELWNGPTQGPGMNSRNHHMFSSISQWMVSTVGGINNVGAGTACGLLKEDIAFAPAALAGVSAADTAFSSPCGDVHLAYKRHGGMQCTRVPEGRSSTRQGAPVVEDAVIDCGSLGGVITAIDFASWGAPAGGCGEFVADAACHASNSLPTIESMCVGKAACSIPTHADFWASAVPSMTCDTENGPRVLAVQARCSVAHALTVSASVPVGVRGVVALPLYGADAATAKLMESGVDATSALGVLATQASADALHVTIGSGSYDFTLTTSA